MKITLAKFVNIWRTAKGKGIDFDSRPEKPKGFLFRLVDLILWYLRYGEVLYFYYIYGFDYKNREDRSEYISERYYLKLLEKKNLKLTESGKGLDYRVLTYDKYLANNYLESLGVPAVHNEALIRNNLVFWDNGEIGDLSSIFERNLESIYIKPIYGSYGAGIMKLTIDSGTFIRGNHRLTVPKLQDELLGFNWVIQKKVMQHSEMDKFNSSAVNTLRIVTILTQGEPEFLTSFMKISTGQSHVDNWDFGSLLVGVNHADGTLAEKGYYKPKKYIMETNTSHPDSNISFDGFRVPYYQEAIEVALQVHSFYYGRFMLGFDFAITEDGPVIIEVNCRPTLPGLHLFSKNLRTRLVEARP